MRLIQPGDTLHNGLAGVAIVAMIGSLGLLVWPKPTSQGQKAKFDRAASLARTATAQAKKRTVELDEENAKLVWTSSAQEVAPVALAKISALANQRKVKLIAFRPQRTNPAGLLDQLPFLLTVDGNFPDVLAFEKDIEKPENKLAVNLFQMASADAASDRVTASIGLVAYLKPVTEKDPVPKTKSPEVKASAAKGEARG